MILMRMKYFGLLEAFVNVEYYVENGEDATKLFLTSSGQKIQMKFVVKL